MRLPKKRGNLYPTLFVMFVFLSIVAKIVIYDPYIKEAEKEARQAMYARIQKEAEERKEKIKQKEIEIRKNEIEKRMNIFQPWEKNFQSKGQATADLQRKFIFWFAAGLPFQKKQLEKTYGPMEKIPTPKGHNSRFQCYYLKNIDASIVVNPLRTSPELVTYFGKLRD